MTILAIIVPSIALVLSAAVTAYFTNRTHAAVKEVKSAVTDVKTEVTSMNGKTVAVLLDETEGRRIEVEIPPGKRTSSEQHYVENLHNGDKK